MNIHVQDVSPCLEGYSMIIIRCLCGFESHTLSVTIDTSLVLHNIVKKLVFFKELNAHKISKYENESTINFGRLYLTSASIEISIRSNGEPYYYW